MISRLRAEVATQALESTSGPQLAEAIPLVLGLARAGAAHAWPLSDAICAPEFAVRLAEGGGGVRGESGLLGSLEAAKSTLLQHALAHCPPEHFNTAMQRWLRWRATSAIGARLRYPPERLRPPPEGVRPPPEDDSAVAELMERYPPPPLPTPTLLTRTPSPRPYPSPVSPPHLSRPPLNPHA